MVATVQVMSIYDELELDDNFHVLEDKHRFIFHIRQKKKCTFVTVK